MIQTFIELPALAAKYLKDSSETLLQSLTMGYPKDVIFAGFLIFVLFFAAYAYLTPNALLNGDAALYSQEIEHRIYTFDIHVGYYLLGLLFTFLSPFSTDFSLNLMNCFFGGLSAAIIFMITYTLTGKLFAAIASGLFLATNYVIIYNSLYAEVYIAHVFFLLLAIYLWLLGNSVLAGLFFAFSFLITPSAVFAIPLFIVIRPRLKDLLRFGLTSFGMISIAIFPIFRVYLQSFSDRLNNETLSTLDAISKEFWEFLLGYFFYIPLVLVGMLQVISKINTRIWGLGIFVMWFSSFVLGERFGDVPVQLPTYALLCTVVGVGFVALGDTSGRRLDYTRWSRLGVLLITALTLVFIRINSVRVLAIFFVVILMYSIKDLFPRRFKTSRTTTGFIALGMLLFIGGLNSTRAFARIVQVNNDLIEYRNTILEMNREASPNYLVIGDWHDGIRFEHYVFHDSYTGRWINTEWLAGTWGNSWQVRAQDELEKATSSGREIWFLGDYPGIFSDLQENGYVIESFRDFYRAQKQIYDLTNDPL